MIFFFSHSSKVRNSLKVSQANYNGEIQSIEKLELSESKQKLSLTINKLLTSRKIDSVK